MHAALKNKGIARRKTQTKHSNNNTNNRYARRNNDVMVFKKIVDSEFEEEFRFVQASLKKSVKSLLRAYLRDSHKRKSTSWVDDLLKKRTSKSGVIYEKEWTDILKCVVHARTHASSYRTAPHTRHTTTHDTSRG
jgi:hypothetical protein